MLESNLMYLQMSTTTKKKKRRHTPTDSEEEVTIIDKEQPADTSKADQNNPSKAAAPASLKEIQDSLTEEDYEGLLGHLQHKFQKHLDKCKEDKLDFTTHGWPRVLKAVRAVKKEIDPKFVPKSSIDRNKYHPSYVDPVAQQYLPFCETLKTEAMAIKTPKTGNCFSSAVSMGLNGISPYLQQESEIRLRASIFYAENCQKIHDEGFRIGWAKATGKHKKLLLFLHIHILLAKD